MCASGGELSRTPSGFATIAVSNNAEKEFTVAFQPSAFPNIESVLDEVFINYLSTRFDPFTYGLEWVLVEDGRHCNRIIGPWEFVCDLFKIPLMSISKWALSTSPDECGFAPGTRWRVCSNLSDFGRNYLVGLALNELRVLMATDRHPKALGAFLRDDVLAVRPFDTVEIENYKLLQPAVIDISYLRHSQSVKFHEDVLRAGARGACLVQTDTPIDGDWLNHYQERY